MTRYLLIGLLMGLFYVNVGFAESEGGDIGKHEMEMKIRRGQMEIEAQEAELNFRRQMHELELEERRAKMKRQEHGGHQKMKKRKNGGKGLFFAIWIFLHILATIWVYKDIQQTKASGLWIPIVLLGGLLGLLVYAVIRTGDICKMYQKQTE